MQLRCAHAAAWNAATWRLASLTTNPVTQANVRALEQHVTEIKQVIAKETAAIPKVGAPVRVCGQAPDSKAEHIMGPDPADA